MIFFLFFLSLSFSLIFFSYSLNWLFLSCYIVLLAILFFKKNKLGIFCSLIGFFVGTALFFCVNKNQGGRISEVGVVVRSESGYFIFKTISGSFYVKLKNNYHEVGDLLLIKGMVCDYSFTHYQESFDFGTYLKSFGAYKQIKDYVIQVRFSNFIRINLFKEFLLSSYSADSRILIEGLVFGSSVNDISTYRAAKNLGISNLLSASGIHLGFLQIWINRIFEQRVKDKWIRLTFLIVVFIIFFIDGFPISIARILLMNFISFLISIRKLPYLSYVEKLSISGTIILFFNPLYVLNKGFFFTYPPLVVFSFLRSFIGYRDKGQRFKMSCYFGLSITGMNMSVNYTLSPLAVLAQFICSPLLSGLFCIDLLVFCGEVTRPFLDRVNYFAVFILSFSADMDFMLVCGKLSVFFTIAYYVFLLFLILIKELNLKKAFKIGSVFFICFICLAFMPDISNHYEVHFIDVGQGDSTLIRYENKNILIDTGGSLYADIANDCLIKYFQSQKITRLDAVLTTHDDYDHVGALEELEKNFPIGEVHKGGEKLQYEFGGFYINDINTYKSDTADSNYNSSVYSFAIDGTSFLIMGDAPTAIENKIIDSGSELECDVLKVGHHGSDTSSCFDFLKYTSPNMAVISCGLNNKYGHPSKSVIQSLEILKIPYVRTDLGGTYIYRIR